MLQINVITTPMMTNMRRTMPFNRAGYPAMGSMAPGMFGEANNVMGQSNQPTGGPAFVSAPQYNDAQYFNPDDSSIIAQQQNNYQAQQTLPVIDLDIDTDRLVDNVPAQSDAQFKVNAASNGAARAIYGQPMQVQKRGFASSAQSAYIPFQPKSNDPYDVLGISRNATDEQIAAAYKKLAKQYHPDLNQNNKEQATQAFQMINNAKDQINNPNGSMDDMMNSAHPDLKKWHEWAKTEQERRARTFTPLTQAIYDQNIAEIKKLIGERSKSKRFNSQSKTDTTHANGVNLNELDPQGRTPLTLAIKTGNIEIINFLIDHGADINQMDRYSQNTPLTTAISHANPDIVQLLIQAGANINQVEGLDFTPLARSIIGYRLSSQEEQRNLLKIMRILIDHGANVSQSSSRGNVLLIEAVDNESVEIAKLLIDAGADINQIDANGYDWTPLTKAIAASYTNIVKFLIENGVDIYKKDGQGNVPLELAESRAKTNAWGRKEPAEVAQLLKNAILADQGRDRQGSLQELD